MELPEVGPDKGLEVGASDLFLQFPDELDVDRNAGFNGVTGRQQSGQRRPLVVGGPAS